MERDDDGGDGDDDEDDDGEVLLLMMMNFCRLLEKIGSLVESSSLI
tara:strand:- start:267 stop:404 length:138 start_codon:yes stop_codon:yes gene_type:complete